MGTNISWQMSQEQTSEDEVGLVVIREESYHLVLQMQGFLVPGEREGNQSLESLIIVQRVQGY